LRIPARDILDGRALEGVLQAIAELAHARRGCPPPPSASRPPPP
jgi:hypothetical protein